MLQKSIQTRVKFICCQPHVAQFDSLYFWLQIYISNKRSDGLKQIGGRIEADRNAHFVPKQVALTSLSKKTFASQFSSQYDDITFTGQLSKLRVSFSSRNWLSEQCSALSMHIAHSGVGGCTPPPHPLTEHWCHSVFPHSPLSATTIGPSSAVRADSLATWIDPHCVTEIQFGHMSILTTLVPHGTASPQSSQQKHHRVITTAPHWRIHCDRFFRLQIH